MEKPRHIEVNQLWIQDKAARGDIELVKVPGSANVADALTKAVESADTQWHMQQAMLTIVDGRHDLMPHNDNK